MPRVYTKIGDVFSVKVSDTGKKYFQLIAYDKNQLTSDVIRAFKTIYPIDSVPNLAEIISGEVEFYTHCVTKWGVNLNCWEKVGSVKDVGAIDHILFRHSLVNDLRNSNTPLKAIVDGWFVWRINDTKFTQVGKLVGENRNAEIGIVVNPYDVVERMQTGKFSFSYPGFE